MPKAAETVFAQLRSGGWTAIRDLMHRTYDESLHLDFIAPSGTSGQLEREDKRNLAKALSGFANSEGGVVVWGVDARPNSEGLDEVVRISPIQDLRRLINELNGATPELASPLIPGVRHEPIEVPEEPNVGVALSLIPESDCGPHMARGKDLHSYYRRSGSSFRILEHNEVADLFGRRPQAVLYVSARARAELAGSGPDGRTARMALELVVGNHGRGLGRFVSLSLGEPGAWRTFTAPHIGGVQSPFRHLGARGGWWLRYAAAADDVIYSDDTVEFACLSFHPGKRQLPSEDLVLEYRLDAEGIRPIVGTVTVSLGQTRKAFDAVVGGLDVPVELATAVVPAA